MQIAQAMRFVHAYWHLILSPKKAKRWLRSVENRHEENQQAESRRDQTFEAK